jgi:hypothetical protein
MKNKFKAFCYRCTSFVEVNEVKRIPYQGRWRLQHADCVIKKSVINKMLANAIPPDALGIPD